jgi:hypothetical protein
MSEKWEREIACLWVVLLVVIIGLGLCIIAVDYQVDKLRELHEATETEGTSG